MDDRISAEEVELLEKKKEMRELSKERRRTKVEGWRDTDAAEVKLLRRQHLGLKAPNRRLAEPEVSWKGTGWNLKSAGYAKSPPREGSIS